MSAKKTCVAAIAGLCVAFAAVADENVWANGSVTLRYVDGPEVPRTGDKEFRGGVLLEDGRIVLVPRTGQYVGEYDPASNVFEHTAPHHHEGGFGMGALADGEVILTPRGSRNVGVYDPETRAYRDGAAHGQATDNAFLGSAKVSPELVVFGPLLANVVGLYNPETDVYWDGPEHNETDAYAFSTVTKSSLTGDVIFTPFRSAHVGVYDPRENTYRSGARVDEEMPAYSGSVEAKNGKIIMAPRNAAHIGIYDPVSDELIRGPEHGEGGGAFMAAELLPCGLVIMAPYRSEHVGVYDPDTNEYWSGPSVSHVPVGAGRFSGAILTQAEDKVVMPNRGANVIGLVLVE